MSHPFAAARVVAVRPSGAASLALVEQVTATSLIPRPDLVGVHGPRPGSGRTDGEFWQGGAWFVKSRATRCYADAIAGTAALDALHALKLRLGPLTPSASVLVLAAGARGVQLWTIAPRLVTLRERLDETAAAAQWSAFAQALAGFARGLGEAIACSIDGGLGLDANPANFAVQGGRLRYIDDDVTATRDALGVEDAFVARIAEYADAPVAVWAAYADRFADEVAARLDAERRRALGLAARLVAAAGLRRAAEPLARRVLARLERAP